MRIQIIEDEIQSQQKIVKFVEQFAEEENQEIQIRCYSSGKGFISNFKAGNADIYIIDIYLGDMNGIEIAKRIREVDSEGKIVFSSNSREFAIEGYKVKAFDYLVKPYEYKELKEMLYRCMDIEKKEVPYIEVKQRRLMIKIPIDTIMYTTYSNHYVYIHTTDVKNNLIKTYMPFAEMEQMLGVYSNFICCYRNTMINLDSIAQIKDLHFVVYDGTEVPINRKLKKEIKQAYSDYLFNQYAEKEKRK